MKRSSTTVIKRVTRRPRGPLKKRRAFNIPYSRRRNIIPRMNVKRMIYSTNFQFGNAAISNYWNYYQPTLNNAFNNWLEFSALFDEYKVNGIKITFVPRFDSLAAPVTGATPMTVLQPMISYCIDPSSTLTPSGLYNSTTYNTFLEQGNVKIRRATKPVSIFYRPKIEIPTNVGGGFVYRRPGWLSTNSTAVPFKGVHVFMHTNNFSTQNTDINYDVFFTWYISVRNIK